MNKRITLNQLILAISCSLLTSGYALADRPAMDDQLESLDLEIIDISTDIQEAPAFEEMPIEEMPAQEELAMPAMENDATVDNTALEQIMDEAEPEPVIHVYDHRTETQITGDVVELQAGDTLPVNIIDFPSRGMTMNKVKNELGEPIEISETIGEPPITSWIYNDRIVYFEYSSVVHVVAAH